MFASLGKTLKGMVYEDGPVDTPQQAQQAQKAADGSLTQSGLATNSVNTDMVNAIKRVTFGRNTAFTQLLAAAESLADVIPDQTMRLKAAHKTAGGGRTGRQIADAVDVHLQDVDGEEMRFKQAVDQKAASEIAGIEAEASLATQGITNAQAEIQQAQQRIIDLNSRITEFSQKAHSATTTVAQKRAELDAATSQFKIAAGAVRQELNTQKSAILSTLV